MGWFERAGRGGRAGELAVGLHSNPECSLPLSPKVQWITGQFSGYLNCLNILGSGPLGQH